MKMDEMISAWADPSETSQRWHLVNEGQFENGDGIGRFEPDGGLQRPECVVIQVLPRAQPAEATVEVTALRKTPAPSTLNVKQAS